MTDPVALMDAIDADCSALDSAAKRLEEITDELGQAELEYLDERDKALIKVEDDYRKRDEKLPSEQQREARAHQIVPRDVRKRFVELKREKDLIETWGRMREKALSGRQSQLSFLKAEGNAPAGEQPQWTPRRVA